LGDTTDFPIVSAPSNESSPTASTTLNPSSPKLIISENAFPASNSSEQVFPDENQPGRSFENLLSGDLPGSESQTNNNQPNSPDIQPGSDGIISLTEDRSPLQLEQSPPSSPALQSVSISLISPNGSGYNFLSDGNGVQVVPQSVPQQDEVKLDTQAKTEQVAPPQATSSHALLSDVEDFVFTMPTIATPSTAVGSKTET